MNKENLPCPDCGKFCNQRCHLYTFKIKQTIAALVQLAEQDCNFVVTFTIDEILEKTYEGL